jgi:cytidylate kinase
VRTEPVGTSEQPPIILITGIMAAGKSTVAQSLAERLPRSVHLRGDVFRRMIVSGRATMTARLSHEATEQLRLRYRIAAAAARLYLKANFTVVYQDIILGASLAEVVGHYSGCRLHVVVLCPAGKAVATREAGRIKKGYIGIEVADLDEALRSQTPRIGLWVDSSAQSVEQTVNYILSHLEQARVGTDGQELAQDTKEEQSWERN